MSDSKPVRYYDAGKNFDGASLPGVPLRDLTESEFDALPVWLQLSIDASPFFRKTRPPTETAPLKRASTAEKD